MHEWITKITDISDEVYNMHKAILEKRFSNEVLPKEVEYPVNENTKRILGM